MTSVGQERLAGTAGGRAPRARRWSARPSWSATPARAIGALVTLDPESVEAWLRDHQRPPTPVAELVEDPELLADVQAAVDAANATVSSAEAIKRFRILPVDLTEASGHLTPTLKIKRSVVLRDFAADLEALYAKR